MPTFRQRAIMSGLVAMGAASATSAISLSNFTPRIENLPGDCQAVYTREISGCVAADFTTQGQRCSANCVNGLVEISKAVTQACGSVDVPETSIIGVFLLGQGIPALCPGVQVTTIAPSSTPAPAPPPSKGPPPPAEQSSAAETSQQEQPSSSASPTSTGGIAIDTTVPTTLVTAFPNPPANTAQPPSNVQTSSTQSQPTANSQKSNQDSGGGSPFDIVATGSSPALAPIRSLALGVLGAVALIFATL